MGKVTACLQDEKLSLYVVLCAIWYHFYFLKIAKNNHTKKNQKQLYQKETVLHGCFNVI